MPALAFGSHYFVFKERPGTHRSSWSWCRVSQRTVPDVLLKLESLLRAPDDLGGPVRRACHLTRLTHEGQRVLARKTPTPGRRRGASHSHRWYRRLPPRPRIPQAPMTWAFPPTPADRRQPPTPLVACGEPLRPPARHPVSGYNRLSAPRSPPKKEVSGGRAPPVVYRDLPHGTYVRTAS